MIKYCLLLLPLLLFGCSNNAEKTAPSAAEKVFSASNLSITAVGDKTLKINYPNSKPETYIAKGPCTYLLSPDFKHLAINSRPMSNLGITEIFSAGEDGKIDFSQSRNISTEAWGLIEQRLKIKSDAVLFPSTHAVRWAQGGKVLELKVSGGTEAGDNFEEIASISIE